jgi:hypothetical protein
MDEAHYCAEAFSPITGRTGSRAQNRAGPACAVCAVRGANPAFQAHRRSRSVGEGGLPTVVSRNRAAEPHNHSKPAGRLSRYPTRTPSAVPRHVRPAPVGLQAGAGRSWPTNWPSERVDRLMLDLHTSAGPPRGEWSGQAGWCASRD